MTPDPGTERFTPFFSSAQISVKSVVVALGTALAMLTVLWVFWRATFSISLIATALLLAIAIDHPVQWLVTHGWRRGLAITATMLGLVLVLLAFAFVFVPPAVQQGVALVTQAPSFVDHVRESKTYARFNARLGLDENLAKLPAAATQEVSRIANGLLTVLGNAALVVAAGLTIFFLALFMLLFGPDVVRATLDEARRRRRPYYERIVRRIYTSFGGYIGGLAIISTANAAITSLFLAVLKVPFFLPLGLLTGLLNLIPNIGSAVAILLVALVALAAGGLGKAIATVVFLVGYKQIENQFFGPLIFKRAAAVDPLIGMVAVLFMTEVAGVPGAFVAIPVLTAVQIVLNEVLAIRREWLQREAPEDVPASAERVSPRKP
jgi:predicted PurR-regulated permease PerM